MVIPWSHYCLTICKWMVFWWSFFKTFAVQLYHGFVMVRPWLYHDYNFQVAPAAPAAAADLVGLPMVSGWSFLDGYTMVPRWFCRPHYFG